MQRFEGQKHDLSILTKTKQELIDMLPKSDMASSIADMPVPKAIGNALKTIEASRDGKNDVIAEAVQKLANLNLTEELLQIANNGKSKEGVFSEQKEIFN